MRKGEKGKVGVLTCATCSETGIGIKTGTGIIIGIGIGTGTEIGTGRVSAIFYRRTK